MTHTNHRLGDRKSLQGDYVLFAMTEPALTSEQRNKLKGGFKKALEICNQYNPVLISTDLKDTRERDGIDSTTPGRILLPDGVRFRARWIKYWKGGEYTGIVDTREEILAIEQPQRWCSVVYDNKDSLEKALNGLKEADLGLSVVVSGIFEDVFEICAKIGVGPHTVNMSAGIWGRTDLLPGRKILEITKMCGHGYISRYLVEHLIDQVRRGHASAEEAGVEMSKQCICNFFNPVRAANLIREYIGSSE
jgi:hypothetical protein